MEDWQKKLKQSRLKEYDQKMFILQMDIAALEAIDAKEQVEERKQAFENIKKSYAAVEAIT